MCNKKFNTFPSILKIGKGKYCSQGCAAFSRRGIKLSKEHKAKIIIRGEKSHFWKGGRMAIWPHCVDCGKVLANRYAKRCNKHKGIRGDKSPHWKGGVTPLNQSIRISLKYKEWRRKVFERDDYTCQICRKRGGNMNADHIRPFSTCPSWRFRLSNGRTLCEECHKTTDTYGYSIKMRGYKFLQSYY